MIALALHENCFPFLLLILLFQVEGELTAIRKELETTKKALKVQTTRCRNLVAAFTKRLAEKDAEVRSCRETREKQLSSLLRALLVLEARLRREQKNIKDMLADKDNIINDQRLEIERLKCEVKYQEEASIVIKEVVDDTKIIEGIIDIRSSPDSQPTREVYAKPDLISSLGISVKEECGPDSLSSDTASTKSCLGDESDYTTPGPQMKGVLNIHNRSAFSPINKNKNEQRAIYTSFPHSVPDISKSVADDSGSVKPSALLQEVRIGNRPDEYRDNPVLQCVNQILLKDQEDFLEEQRTLRMKDPAWLDEDDSPVDEEEVVIAEGRPESPAEKSTEDDKQELEITSKKSVSMTDLSKGKMAPRLNPPLPPKPKLNGTKRVEFADIKPTTVQFHNPPMVLPPPQAIDSTQLGLPLSILGPVDQGQDNELYVISNSALDDDIVKQLRGRTLNVSGLHIKPQRITTDRNQHSNVPTGLLHPSHKSHASKSVVSCGGPTHHVHRPATNVLKVNIQESPKRNSFGFKSPPKVGMPNMIKVASPVATLLTTAGAQESGNKEEGSPSVSQMVRRFEEISVNNNSAEDSDAKSDEIKSEVESNGCSPADSSVSYDNFLEATGLSQKSIMTPSRMMTNHRNVVKPKDVKLRSKVKAAGVIERCIPPQVVGPTIKYWTEPFL